MPPQILSIIDDKIVINKLHLTWSEGNITHLHNFNVEGSVAIKQSLSINKNLKVGGELTVDTIKVKNIIKDGQESVQLDAFTFKSESSAGLDNKGLVWKEDSNSHVFVYKDEPRCLFSSENIDIHKSARYQIGGVDVLEYDRISPAIVHSSLRTVGELNNLTVRDYVNIGNKFSFNATTGRVGFNTDKPNGAFSIVDKSTEIIIGANQNGHGIIGTWSNKPLSIVTDNVQRITINGSNIEIGSAISKNSVVKINGTLEVDTLINDIRIEKTSSVEFIESNSNGVYSKGLSWVASNGTKRLHLFSNPDRIFSTEDIDLEKNRCYRIGKTEVVTETSLGPTVKTSNLSKLGVLESLEVQGNVSLQKQLIVDSDIIAHTLLKIDTGSGSAVFSNSGIETNSIEFNLKLNNNKEFVINNRGNIALGNVENQSRVVNIYGQVAINVNNPPSDIALCVNGTVMFNNKKFSEGSAPPVSGNWNKGDIMWNDSPMETNYVGWVCISSGNPGTWKPFGYIGTR